MAKAQSKSEKPKVSGKVVGVAAAAVVGAGVAVAARSILKKKENRDKIASTVKEVADHVKSTREKAKEEVSELAHKATGSTDMGSKSSRSSHSRTSRSVAAAK